MEKYFTLGIDIGGTNIAWGIIDSEGQCLANQTLNTTAFDTIVDVATAIHQQVSDLGYISQLQGVGIGAPAANRKTGFIHHASNLPWKGDVPLMQIFQQIFKCKVVIDNDANASAYAEYFYGGATGLENFAVVTIGTGIGSGIMSAGNIVNGFDGNGGELGHVILWPEGRACGCGRYGCLETYTSAKGMHTTALELLQENEKSLLHQLDDFSTKDIYAAAQQGDALALDVFQRTGYHLGIGLANMVTLLGTESIFLYGGPVNAGNLLLNATHASFQAHVIHFYKDKVHIQTSALQHSNGAIYGAAALAL